MRAAGRSFALVLVVRTEGSTYRKPGALALVEEDGAHTGVISGGCLEPGVEALARDAMRSGAPRLVVFDTRSDDDLLFGSSSGCRGRMHVLALPADAGSVRSQVDAIIRAGVERRTITLPLRELAPAHFDSGDVTIQRSRHLLLIGAGPEARPMLRIARTLGWHTSITDHREALLLPDRVGPADRSIVARPGTALAALNGERVDAALVMTHVATTDLEALRGVASMDVPYVGLLGPPARRDELLAQLTKEQRVALERRLRAPVGLQLGGEGPEAIALAIAAELQMAFQAR